MNCALPGALDTYRPPAWVRYGAALGAVALGTAVRYALRPTPGSGVPYITFVPAVAFSAWFGGLGPGLLATALGGIAALYLSASMSLENVADALGGALYVAVGSFITVAD